ncbi:chromosome transmission fidelity protein 8 homolog [Xenia sp. Carnegie-2017]|uniref:chromosome transmission fidelity protein 8 homolog n=1 Tax=Xenia sp. Carnegie-2017 TaxID=2897299 RepID=UPI001F0428D1|nr:chromosome transmission fidelity protein 8 homolog [Xenia sp. Carnegie-2017]
MVQILVKFEPAEKDWIVIELQGVLESNKSGGYNGLPIGDLHFDEKGQPLLIIGHHLLSGKVVTLEKPFAVLKKTKIIQEEGCQPTTEYIVQALIRKKIIFKTRPKPIIVKKKKSRK